jgi:hypothetical protein
MQFTKSRTTTLRYLVTLVEDEKGEGHILLGDSAGDATAKEGDKGTITFTRGGPLGGYWQFKKDPTP